MKMINNAIRKYVPRNFEHHNVMFHDDFDQSFFDKARAYFLKRGCLGRSQTELRTVLRLLRDGVKKTIAEMAKDSGEKKQYILAVATDIVKHGQPLKA